MSNVNKNDSGVGFAPSVLPRTDIASNSKNSGIGVSTLSTPLWYVIRAAYGKESDGVRHLQDNGFEVFYPTITATKIVDGKRRNIVESRIPNIFFAFGSFDQLKDHIYNNVSEDTKHLRFYYAHYLDGSKGTVTVPQKQMDTLKIICGTGSADVYISQNELLKFKVGQHVVVTDGNFKGVEGIVARHKGQQRVGIVINGMLTATTAYIPSAFLRKLDN